MDGERLIAKVEKNPVLYDKTYTGFKDVAKKNDIWREIGLRLPMKCSGKQF